MTPEQLDRRADRLLEVARAFVADLNNDDLRRAYMKASFNLDYTAQAIVCLADRRALAPSSPPPLKED